MKIDNKQSVLFKGVHVSKSSQFSYEQKQLIALIKRQLLNGKVVSDSGRDLYKKFDRKGYNFFISGYSFISKDSVQVTLDKVKTDSNGHKSYATERVLGPISRNNISVFPEKVRQFNKERNKDIALGIGTAALSMIAAFITAMFIYKNK